MPAFTEKSLNLMPSQGLTGLSNALTVDKGTKQIDLATTNAKVSKLDGTSTLRTPVGGRIAVNSGGAPASQKQQANMSAPAQSAANAAVLLNSPGSNPTGAPVFAPGTVAAGTTSQDVDDMAAQVNEYYGKSDTTANPITSNQIASLSLKASQLKTEIAEIDTTLASISSILARRASGELPNPVLNVSALSIGNLPPSLAAKAAAAIESHEKFVQKQIIVPFMENQQLVAALQAQASGSLSDLNPTFDLDFGPPISSDNKFILSRDGLYYDSRTKPVPRVTPYPVSSGMWDLDYASNRGGRGVGFTENDSDDVVDSIFDLNIPYQESNPRVADFLLYDDVIQQFKDDKQSHMMEVSGYITEILANGYGATDALVQSYTAQLGAVASVYDNKIKKRKRQLTIAAVFGRNTFFVTDRMHQLGQGVFFQYEPAVGKAFEYMLQYDELPDSIKNLTFLETQGGQTVLWNTRLKKVVEDEDSANILARVGKWVEIPRVPINDFSYLKQSDIPLNLQKKITLFSEDLDTIVAPYQAKYVVAPSDTPPRAVESLAVDEIGFGDWTHRQTSGSLSATLPLYKSLTDDIMSDKLVVCYNFLDPDAVTQPSGNLYALNNAAEGSDRLDGKLVGYNPSFVFPSGVGQAFFGGTIFDEQASQNPLWAQQFGSYVRLPNSTKNYNTLNPNLPYFGVKPLDNLFYSQSGVCLDFWAYVPNIHTAMTDNHRYRLVLANENSGPIQGDYVNASTQTKSTTGRGLAPGGTNFSRTIGMIMGWRDRGSPTNSASWESSGLEFCIAPTVGQNQPYATTPDTTWGHSVCIAEKWDASAHPAPTRSQVSQVGMFISSSVVNSSGTGIHDVSSGYHHFNVSFDYYKEKVNFHLDGELLITSSLTDVLGGSPQDTVLPTATKIDFANQADFISYNDPTTESFLGNGLYDERVTPERVAFPVFTPWTIGGGYSDNMPKPAGTTYRPEGFLGSNTNNTWQNTQPGASVSSITIGSTGDYIVGQHNPPLSSGKGGTAPTRILARSGLDGYLGSFKIYSRPLTTTEAKRNYDSQKGFFNNILLPSP